MARWRDDTHWYRPIRLTDERRFLRDMHAGWIACGAIRAPTMDEMLAHFDAVAEIVAQEFRRPSPLLRLFR